MGADREDLIAQLDLAGRVQSTVAVMFHTALAELSGLSATEQKALDLIERFGPLTAGELAERSGLAPASVTGLLSRLERKGFARRVPNPDDRRSVLVEMVRGRLDAIGPHFLELLRPLHQLYDTFTDDELRAVLRYLTAASQIQQEATTRLPKPDH
ncbi:MarR family transcriptional regulator [Cryptosporangium phraense]|uniref:MarR family transcriptional regulator n=1 Tax=Cryptosporangium phraense TaxID=2593070 RepID=UPI00197A780E|nr:MarR family transcriptional regulator [Cryptosporangium phraense]